MFTASINQIGGGLEARPRAYGVLVGTSRRLVRFRDALRATRRVAPTLAFMSLLFALLPFRSYLYFNPDAVAAGQWWRVLTHPFVHVSWYHLLLDGSAFVLLYRSLEQRRLSHLVAAGAGSLLASLWYWPTIGQTGLCGLSGMAHGLMAVSALEMIRRQDRLGWLCLLLVAGKSIWEAVTGQVFFTWLHFGLMGTPVAVCHLGGVVGGMLVWSAPACWRFAVHAGAESNKALASQRTSKGGRR